MSDCVKIVECPRDAWQGLGAKMPVELKVGFTSGRLIRGPLHHLDAVSFCLSTTSPR